jgi:spoIIIJ-associated protein
MNTAPIVEFVERVVEAMGLDLAATVEDEADGVRINLNGDDGSVLTRRQGEALQALQQIVGAAFRGDRTDERRVVVDCNGYRRDKDAELHQMAAFLAEKARSTGLAQEMGPLNPYERRIVHLAVAAIESVTSESIGDAFEKTVIISVKSTPRRRPTAAARRRGRPRLSRLRQCFFPFTTSTPPRANQRPPLPPRPGGSTTCGGQARSPW